MALNESRTWDGDVAEIVTDTSNLHKPTVRDAFFRGMADKVLLPTGMTIYKFNDFATLARGDAVLADKSGPFSAEAAAYNAQTISPWWSPYLPYRHDPGWIQRVAMAKHFGVSIRELGRLTSVIRENWNSLQILLVVTLRMPVYGFHGGFASMARKDLLRKTKMVTSAPQGKEKGFVEEKRGTSANLPGAGGASQFYIPNMRPSHVTDVWTQSLLDK